MLFLIGIDPLCPFETCMVGRDPLYINGGTLNIEAAKSCLHSNDGIEINAGVNYCLGGTNGIKTDGYINITGGSSVFIGGVREEKGAIYCDGSLSVTGGSFCVETAVHALPDINQGDVAVVRGNEPARVFGRYGIACDQCCHDSLETSGASLSVRSLYHQITLVAIEYCVI